MANPVSEPIDEPPPPSDGRRGWLVLWLIFAVLALIVGYAGWQFGQSRALAELEARTRTEAGLKAALMQAALERPRALPLVLSLDREIAETLATRSGTKIDRLNRKLEQLVRDSQASVIYVIGPDGRAIASSNWREPTSFIGSNYGFRDYFRKAMSDRQAEQFALGNVSKRPGLYLSRRVDDAAGIQGVVVVKTEFDRLETSWRTAGQPAFITDPRGVILITSVPELRFRTLWPLDDAARKAIRSSLQYGERDLEPLPQATGEPLTANLEKVTTALPGIGRTETYLHLSLPVAATPWILHYYMPASLPLRAGARQAMALALAALVPFLAAAIVLLRRRQAALDRLAEAARNTLELERRVRERTDDLSRARDALEAEVAGHRSTELKLKGVQQELVAANRLAILGQVAAGVAHEVNQPLATIRAYAENGATFIDRGRPVEATENFGAIARLTERIAGITEELRSFARKGRRSTGPVALREVLEGAALLLRSRFAGQMDALKVSLPDADLMVLGEHIRLEQVFINLFQNALEALQDQANAQVEVEIETAEGLIRTRVRDNGPGLPEGIMSQLFSPFNTSKEQGLGLGLVISQEIVADFGGRIEVASSPEGATFDVYLQRA